MRADEVSIGTLEAIELRVFGGGDPPRVGTEVLLRWSPQSQSYQMVSPTTVFEVEATSARHERDLARLSERSSHFAWVVASEDGLVRLGVRTLATSLTLDRPFSVLVGDSLLAEISTRVRVPVARVVEWLTEEFVLQAAPHGGGREDASGRVLVAAGGARTFEVGGRIFGRSAAIDLHAAGGRIEATRFVQNPQAPDSALAIVSAPIEFIDASASAQFEATGRTELERIVRESNSYLGMWDRYNDIEASNIARAITNTGYARVRRIEIRDDGLDIYLTDAASEFLDRISESDLMLEVSETLPGILSGEVDHDGMLDEADDRQSVSGVVAGFDRQRSKLHLRIDADVDLDTLHIGSEGYVFPSVRGDRTRLTRRRAARSRIARGDAAIPHLGLVLEGRATTAAGKQRKLKLSEAALACFHGEPTEKQRDALAVALGSPDIAIIQGPPGTGKTQVIAALQVILSEQAEGDIDASQRILLTSYQHDAVEHAVSRTRVFGLPPARLTSRFRSGARDPVELWREEQIQALEADLSVAGSDDLTVLREAQRWLRVYQLEPLAPSDVARLIESVLDLAGAFLSAETGTRLDAIARDARAEASRRSLAEEHLGLRAVRALPTSIEGFADDGPWRIEKVVARLEPLGALTQDEVSRLRAISEAEPAQQVLDELDEVRGALLDRLTAPAELQDLADTDPEVVAVLTAAVGEIEASIVQGASATDLVIDRFVDELIHDPDGVQQAIRGYTAVFAATVQQSVATRMQAAKGVAHADELRFETVIVDEAARANPLDLMIPMSLAERRVILVGDHRQLPHVLEPDVERQVNDSVDTQMTEALSTSLFERLLRQFREDESKSGPRRVVTLDTQFRMHPALGELISSVFYAEDGGLRSGRPAGDFLHSIPKFGSSPAAWVSVPHERGAERRGPSKSRRAEAIVVADELIECICARPELTYGVITFYRAQEREIWRALAARGAARELEQGGWVLQAGAGSPLPVGVEGLTGRVRIGTVDSFQGMEFDVVILSATRSNDLPDSEPRAKYGFLTLSNRLCVAMSRQQRLLITCGDDEMFRGSAADAAVPGLVAFLRYCEVDGVVVHG